MNNIVGIRIRNIRQSLGESMEVFSNRFTTSKGAVNNWEKGVNLPNNIRLKQIAELGGMTVEELLATDNDNIKFQSKGKIKDVALPKYGEVKFIIKNGKIVDSEVVTKYKHR